MLAVAPDAAERARLTFEPAREGVISWNTIAPEGEIAFRLLRSQEPATAWHAYAQWSPQGRRSFSPQNEEVRVEVDVVRAAQPFDGIEIRARGVRFDAIAFSTRSDHRAPQAAIRRGPLLEVPARSQYVVEDERGWCSPASLAMLNAYHGFDFDVPSTARAVFDRAYNGTGNWAFNVAFSGSLGLRAFVVHLGSLGRAAALIDSGIPLAISYGWSGTELPGAPLEHSDGHLAVLCGFTASGDCAVNDPAVPGVRTTYPRAHLERVWQRGGGVAYAVAPAGTDLAALVNA